MPGMGCQGTGGGWCGNVIVGGGGKTITITIEGGGKTTLMALLLPVLNRYGVQGGECNCEGGVLLILFATPSFPFTGLRNTDLYCLDSLVNLNRNTYT